MAKYLNKAPVKKKRGGLIFAVCMVLYSAAFLAAGAYFLNWFWGFIEGYELSRAKVTVSAYMEQLTEEHICEGAADVIAQIDHNIQSEDECRQVVMDVLDQGITYARKSSECTDTKQVYVLRAGSQVIGSFTITSGAEDEYGFAPWSVTDESFDFSFLIGTDVSVSAPEGYPVRLNGVLLDERYISQTEEIPYGVFEEFYDSYELPRFKKVTYQAGPFLGQFEMEVTDPEGNPYTLDETVDLNSFTHNCSDARKAELDTFIQEFMRRYVIFSGCANDSRYTNFANLMPLLMPGSNLVNRMHAALDGLQFAQSRGDKIRSITVHHYVDIGGGKYLCDLTYLVDTTGNEGTVQTTNNVKLIIVETATGLKVEAMISY